MSLVRIDSVSVLSIRRLAASSKLFAILDATDEPRVPERVRALGRGRAVSLYRATADEQLWAIAPYLVHLDVATFDWITEALWADPWGILVSATADLEQLRTHFRRLLTVVGPDGDTVMFRFYDPRVLVSFLMTCSAEQLREVYGPVEWLGWTDWDGYGVVTCRPLGPDEAPVEVRPSVRLRLSRPPAS